MDVNDDLMTLSISVFLLVNSLESIILEYKISLLISSSRLYIVLRVLRSPIVFIINLPGIFNARRSKRA